MGPIIRSSHKLNFFLNKDSLKYIEKDPDKQYTLYEDSDKIDFRLEMAQELRVPIAVAEDPHSTPTAQSRSSIISF